LKAKFVFCDRRSAIGLSKQPLFHFRHPAFCLCQSLISLARSLGIAEHRWTTSPSGGFFTGHTAGGKPLL